MFSKYAYILLLSLLPGFEGRYALLVGPSVGLDVFASFAVATLGTAVLSTALPPLFPLLDRFFSDERLGALHEVYERYIMRARKLALRREKLTFAGLVLFVAVPLPLTGVWTGAAVSYILGLGKRASIPLFLGGLVSNLLTLSIGVSAQRALFG